MDTEGELIFCADACNGRTLIFWSTIFLGPLNAGRDQSTTIGGLYCIMFNFWQILYLNVMMNFSINCRTFVVLFYLTHRAF